MPTTSGTITPGTATTLFVGPGGGEGRPLPPRVDRRASARARRATSTPATTQRASRLGRGGRAFGGSPPSTAVGWTGGRTIVVLGPPATGTVAARSGERSMAAKEAAEAGRTAGSLASARWHASTT